MNSECNRFDDRTDALSEDEFAKFNELIQSLEDLETMYKMFTLLFVYNPKTLVGLLNDMSTVGFGEDAIVEVTPNEPFDLTRIDSFIKNEELSKLMLRNLRTVIQQFALITAYENGVKILNRFKRHETAKKESWLRIMAAFRNSIVHSANLTDGRNKLFKHGENVISWEGISISKSELNHPITMSMVQDGALWKLIKKMQSEIQSLCKIP